MSNFKKSKTVPFFILINSKIKINNYSRDKQQKNNELEASEF